MSDLYGCSAQRGAAVFAAIILIGVVGVVSTMLHYANSFTRLAYQPRTLSALAAGTPSGTVDPTLINSTSPNVGAITPSTAPSSGSGGSGQADCTPGLNDKDPKTGQLYCRCNHEKDSTQKAPTESAGAAQGATANPGQATGQCLPGCKYNVVGATSGKPDLQAQDKTAASKPGQLCYVCVGATCVDNKAAAFNPSGSGAQSSAAATMAAANISAAPNPDEAAKLASQALASGIPAADLSAALEAKSAFYATFDSDPSAKAGVAAAEHNIDAANDQIEALAGQSPQSGGGFVGGSPCIGACPDAGPSGMGASIPGGASAFDLNTNTYRSDIACQADPSCGGVAQAPGGGDGGNVPAPGGIPGSGGGAGGIGGSPGTASQQSTFGASGVASFLSGLARGLGGGGFGGGRGGNSIPAGNNIPQAPGSCNTQYICTGQTLLYRNNQCVDRPVQQCQYGCNGNNNANYGSGYGGGYGDYGYSGYGGGYSSGYGDYGGSGYGGNSGASGTACAQSNGQYGQNGQNGYGTDGQPCMQPPRQPDPSTCTIGTWKALSATANGCTTGWQCVPNGTSTGAAPTASLTCQSPVADVGSSFRITYACQRATGSSGGGFDTQGYLTGASTVIIGTPPPGTNTATYTLGCTNGSQTVGTQCSVQINKPLITLTANPAIISAGATSTVGWVTSGMQSCVVSSPDIAGFTAQNASYTNVNGVATIPPLTASARVYLNCTTFGGGTRATSTTITVR